MKTPSLSGFGASRLRRNSVLWLALVMSGCSAWTTPFVPTNDAQVLERVRVPSTAPITRELRELRLRLERDSQNLPLALEFAQRCLARARAEADPRYLGYAEAALEPWSARPDAPASVLVTRATLRQSNHDFDRALADLDQALKLEPNDAQAWLTRASILQVQGRFAEARRAFLPLLRLTSELISTTCATSLASVTGEAEKSYALLNRAMARNPSASPQEWVWAITTQAEIAARLGKSLEAEQHFRAALQIDSNDVYLLGAYSDFLLDQKRAAEVIDLLRDRTRLDALLLRLALAHGMTGEGLAKRSEVAILRERFAAAHLRGERVHQREEARFALHLLSEPRAAVRLAMANWRVQREPADVRILLESALAARDRAATKEALAWLRETKLEDVHLAQLLASASEQLSQPTQRMNQHDN